jgi:hypothetical protein
MKPNLAIDVHGKRKEWCFLIIADKKYLSEWREDGLKIDEVVNVIPEWIVDLGLTRLWVALEDLGLL